MIFKSGGSDVKKLKLQAQKLIGQGKYDEALQVLKDLAKVTADPEVFNSIGDLYIRKQNHELALENLEKAYRMYKEQDFREIAISIAKKIIRLDKEKYDTYLDLVEMELENGNVDKALDWALELIKLPTIDPTYVGKLLRLINEFANAIQENTEQAAKFERLFVRLQELAESLSIMSLDGGVEFAEPQEFFEKGDFGSYGGFFGPEEHGGTSEVEKKAAKKREEEQEVEKVEFVEKEEEEPETFITSSGFADFLGVEKPSEEVPLQQPEIIETPPPQEAMPVEEVSEKTQVVEEPVIEKEAPPAEGFKTVVEEVPEEVEEEQKLWEKVVPEEVPKKEEEIITEEKPPALEEVLKSEENPEVLRKSFEEFLKITEKKETEKRKVTEKREELKIPQEVMEIKSEPVTKTTQKRPPEVETEEGKKEEQPIYERVERIPDREHFEYLLKVLRELKEDILTFEEWPYPQDPAFDVAKEYYEMKLYQAAVEELQKLLNDPRFRLQAMILLGKIFYERGDLEFAEVILRKAVEEVGYMEKDYLEAYYYLAQTLESMKRFLEAKELYTRVYVFDSNFKSVAEKVKSLRSSVQ